MPGKLETRVTELDRQIAAIGKLILAGMKMLNETQTQVKALATSQRETDGMLQGLIVQSSVAATTAINLRHVAARAICQLPESKTSPAPWGLCPVRPEVEA